MSAFLRGFMARFEANIRRLSSARTIFRFSTVKTFRFLWLAVGTPIYIWSSSAAFPDLEGPARTRGRPPVWPSSVVCPALEGPARIRGRPLSGFACTLLAAAGFATRAAGFATRAYKQTEGHPSASYSVVEAADATDRADGEACREHAEPRVTGQPSSSSCGVWDGWAAMPGDDAREPGHEACGARITNSRLRTATQSVPWRRRRKAPVFGNRWLHDLGLTYKNK